ncbi:MAG: CsiV family protein [Gammaproteobacteria bacterium]|nr:CsiV family protein [Gammaproteobacteria bacterium]
MKKIITAFFILLSLLMSGSTLHAEIEKEQRYYDIEMIFFRHLGPTDPNEQWPVGYFPVNTEKALELHWKKPQGGFISLPKEAYQLTKEANHLKYSKRYQLLQHLAWRQPGLAEKEAIAIHIRAGKPLGLRPELENKETELAANSFRSRPLRSRQRSNNAEAELANQFVYPLEGTVTVILKRYLHLYTDLNFTQQEQMPVVIPEAITTESSSSENIKKVMTTEIQVMPLNDNSTQEPRFYFQSYPVQGHRKMRSKEVHYLDNPRIGIVVLMTPVKMVKKP